MRRLLSGRAAARYVGVRDETRPQRCDCAYAGLCLTPCVQANGRVLYPLRADCPNPWMPTAKDKKVNQ